MNHLIGSAVTLYAEVPSDKVSGTTVTLESLIDPDGNELSASNSLAFGTGASANIASYVWQSTKGTDPIGKYYFIIKTLNGSYENFAKGYFYLKEWTE